MDGWVLGVWQGSGERRRRARREGEASVSEKKELQPIFCRSPQSSQSSRAFAPPTRAFARGVSRDSAASCKVPRCSRPALRPSS